MTQGSPYLSIVLTGRNDNYGGDFNERLQNMVAWLTFWIEGFEIPAELVVVNYNPVADNPSLADVIDWPGNRQFLTIRMITVPSDVHQQFKNSAIRKTVPLYEYIAKNIGVRRANGTFILSTNPDVVYNPDIFKMIARGKLRKNRYYRTDRADFTPDDSFYNGAGWQEYVSQIQANTFCLFLRGFTYKLPEGANLQKDLWRYRLINKLRLLKNLNMVYIEGIANRFSWPVTYDWVPLKFHTSCSGDFMLMHRDHWHELHGHPEDTYLAIHTDALFVSMCGAHGLKESVLSPLIYHQDHERRYEAEGDQEDPSIRQMFNYFQSEGKAMLEMGQAKDYNGPTWGLGTEKLPENVL